MAKRTEKQPQKIHPFRRIMDDLQAMTPQERDEFSAYMDSISAAFKALREADEREDRERSEADGD